jgi:hypothetical protein
MFIVQNSDWDWDKADDEQRYYAGTELNGVSPGRFWIPGLYSRHSYEFVGKINKNKKKLSNLYFTIFDVVEKL